MSFYGTLLPYQPEAVDLMIDRQRVLVAYEMGLGKTVLTIAAVEELMDYEQITEPGLVVCLSSLKYQWADEIHRWTCSTCKGADRDHDHDPTSRALVIDGTPAQRKEQYARARAWEADYVVMNYEQVVNDWDTVRKLPRGFVVIDEATSIKNFRAQRSRRIKKLQAPVLYALTGQPIENRPEELFSIMQFVDDTVLGRFDIFDKAFIVRNGFGGVQRYRNLPALNNRMREAMVRKSRLDEDVAPYLPKVIEPDPRLIDFDHAGARLYRIVAAELLATLQEAAELGISSWSIEGHYGAGEMDGDEAALRGEIMSKMTTLRMLCDGPELVKKAATGGTNRYAEELLAAGLLDKLGPAPKLNATIEVLDDILTASPENKVVLFSFFKPTLQLLREALAKAKVDSVVYDGDMNAQEKEVAKKKFQNDPDCRVFLSSDAGGYGVDLPQANYLINYDLPWSSGKLEQRNARIIRASSEFGSVTLINMLMRGSVEERQYAALRQKKAIASAVIDGKGINTKGGIDMTLESLTAFLSSSTV